MDLHLKPQVYPAVDRWLKISVRLSISKLRQKIIIRSMYALRLEAALDAIPSFAETIGTLAELDLEAEGLGKAQDISFDELPKKSLSRD